MTGKSVPPPAAEKEGASAAVITAAALSMPQPGHCSTRPTTISAAPHEVATRHAKAALRRLVRRFGVDLVRLGRTPRARLLRERNITVVLDVGANVGQYGQTVRAGRYGGRIVSFEPFSGAFATLTRAAASDAAWRCERMALGDADGTAMLNVWSDSKISSLLPLSQSEVESNREWQPVGVEEVRVRRLDSVADEFLESDDRVYLKIDTQGFELPVLRGADTTLARVQGLETELSFAPMYEGQALIDEVVGHLYDSGFQLVWIERVYETPSSGYLLQADGVFLRHSRARTRKSKL